MSNITEYNDIGSLVREMEQDYTSGSGTLTSKYVTSDLYDDISKIYAYLDSKHTTGDKDSLKRDKPFFNICVGTRNIYYRATDIDRKNIKIKATKSTDVLTSFVGNAKLQEWMRKEDFGTFLNKWGLELAGFNSAVTKFVDQGDRLVPMVVPWSRIIVDPIDFNANPKIEILELTEAQLYQRKGYDKEMIDKLCDAITNRETLDKQDKDTKSNYIRLYEVHGNLPLSYLTGKEEDEDTYQQQMHVISFVASKEDGKFDDFTLYSGKEEKDPYLLTALIPTVDGSVSVNGSVKNLFDAQWMVNHTVKAIKDQLDLASKLIFQTSDGNFVGQNALFAIESGDILIHQTNQPLTQLNNNSHDITSLQSFGNMWQGIKAEISGVSESMAGNTAPSGTAWRQVEALLQESHSLFELMTENKGLAIETMMREFVIPHLKKQLDTKDEIVATLDGYGIDKINAMYVKKEASKRLIDTEIENFLNDRPAMNDLQGATNQVQDEMALQGGTRFLKPSEMDDKTWKDIFKNYEWEVEVDVTGEASFAKEDLATLSTIFQTIANPATQQVLQTPQGKMLFNKILTLTGTVSPLEIAEATPQQPVQPIQSPMQPVELPIAQT